MSFLLDTDLLSLLERKQEPAKLVTWVQAKEAEIFLSVDSFAELQFGLAHAPRTHKPALSVWLEQTRRKFAGATEPLTEPTLVRWKQLLSELKARNRAMSCEDSLIAATALFHGHVVATHNRRHFEPAGVEIFDPLA